MGAFHFRSFRFWIAPAVIVAATLVYLAIRSRDAGDPEKLYLQNKNFSLQTELHAVYRTQSASVVMLGNSLTYNVNWNELLGRSDIVNRGISSDVTGGYLHRLDDIFRLHPKLCFVMGGINDIYAEVPVADVFHNYAALIDSLLSRGVIPVIQSTLYVNPRWPRAAQKNPSVRDLNGRLERLASERGIRFIDLNVLLSSGGILRDDLTYDGLHLRAQGYVLWRSEIEKTLRENGL